MQFTKMQGAGNDYVFVDCFRESLPPDPASLARAISDRRFGVGGDGLILIIPTDDVDAEMRTYNADGSYSGMCGNGIRCVAKYLYEHEIAKRDSLRIASGGKLYDLQLTVAGNAVKEVRVDMGEPIFEPARIPTTLPGHPPVAHMLALDGCKSGDSQNEDGASNDRELEVTCLSMGNPHCVVFVEEATDELVQRLGPRIENDERFPERTNVEFVEAVDRRRVRQRTWERGSGETFACGTGACAVCVAGALTGRTQREVTIELRGGRLQIKWDETTNRVSMTGPAEEVFQGEWPDA